MFGGNKFAYKIPQMRRPALPFSQPRSTVQSLLNRQLQRVKRHRLDGLPACLHTPKLDAALQITTAANARPASMLQHARQQLQEGTNRQLTTLTMTFVVLRGTVITYPETGCCAADYSRRKSTPRKHVAACSANSCRKASTGSSQP